MNFHKNYNIPPQTDITWPVIYVLISEPKNTQTLATSSTSPARFKGIACAQPSTTFGSSTSVISVRINPGATTLVRILREPSSLATDFEKPPLHHRKWASAHFQAGHNSNENH